MDQETKALFEDPLKPPKKTVAQWRNLPSSKSLEGDMQSRRLLTTYSFSDQDAKKPFQERIVTPGEPGGKKGTEARLEVVSSTEWEKKKRGETIRLSGFYELLPRSYRKAGGEGESLP